MDVLHKSTNGAPARHVVTLRPAVEPVTSGILLYNFAHLTINQVKDKAVPVHLRLIDQTATQNEQLCGADRRENGVCSEPHRLSSLEVIGHQLPALAFVPAEELLQVDSFKAFKLALLEKTATAESIHMITQFAGAVAVSFFDQGWRPTPPLSDTIEDLCGVKL